MRLFWSVLFLVIFINADAQAISLLFRPLKVSFGGKKSWWYKETVVNIDKDVDAGSQVIDSVFQKNSPGGEWSNTRPQFITVFDCNDFDASVYHGAIEVCNDIDDNCNGQVDEWLAVATYYSDVDGDGYGNPSYPVQDCMQPDGTVTNSGDCDDNNVLVHTPLTYYVDGDLDGYGSILTWLCSASAPEGYSNFNGDCNDSNNSINPAAAEQYNGMDDNCDGVIDDGFWVTNPLINGFCNELVQWDRQHVDISMYSLPFMNNYLALHPQCGTFTNGIANQHFIYQGTSTGSGMNFIGCSPFPNQTQKTCDNTPVKDCNADGNGCYGHGFDYYPQLCQFYGQNGISLLVNINPYVKDWTTQKKYIDIPLSYGVHVTGVVYGCELAVPSWYANSYYYPGGVSEYVQQFNKLVDSVHKYFSGIPVLVWFSGIWDNKGYNKTWCDGITGIHADGYAPYGESQNITNEIIPSGETESQAVDRVLKFEYWLTEWENKVFAKLGRKPVNFLTMGTNPNESATGFSFLGSMQTEYQLYCLQFDTSGMIQSSQEYRTRTYTLNKSTMTKDVLIRMKRGEMYAQPSVKEKVETGNPKIVAWRFTYADGASITEVLNFSDEIFIVDGSVEGWSVSNLLNSTDSSMFYEADGAVSPRSISFVKHK